ncbi:MAG: hypothetical protein LBS77_06070 [Desulfovibrio sp.]|nr:hypothetical protein [Desulfovibrio sp.]
MGWKSVAKHKNNNILIKYILLLEKSPDENCLLGFRPCRAERFRPKLLREKLYPSVYGATPEWEGRRFSDRPIVGNQQWKDVEEMERRLAGWKATRGSGRSSTGLFCTSYTSQNTVGGGFFVGYDFFPQHQVPIRTEIEYAIRTNMNTSWSDSGSGTFDIVDIGRLDVKGADIDADAQWNTSDALLQRLLGVPQQH